MSTLNTEYLAELIRASRVLKSDPIGFGLRQYRLSDLKAGDVVISSEADRHRIESQMGRDLKRWVGKTAPMLVVTSLVSGLGIYVASDVDRKKLLGEVV